jgi:hypothetical protein
MAFKWDDWRGNAIGETGCVAFEDATMLIKRLFSFRGWNVDLHCFLPPGDAEGCFHTYPSKAFRLILWGGYAEELESGFTRLWWPGMAGFVSAECSHRISGPLFKRSYSLWIRSPKWRKVELRGDGWTHEQN